MHVTGGVVPSVAVTMTVSPSVTPCARIAGVTSLVTLSVEDAPVSDDSNRLGVSGAAIAEIVTVIVEDVGRSNTSRTEYVTAVVVPVNPPSGVNVMSPLETLILQVPWLSTVNESSLQEGGVSVGLHRRSDVKDKPVPVSFKSGVKTVVLLAVPVAVSGCAKGRAGA